jgi:hypothetical protein
MPCFTQSLVLLPSNTQGLRDMQSRRACTSFKHAGVGGALAAPSCDMVTPALCGSAPNSTTINSQFGLKKARKSSKAQERSDSKEGTGIYR